jgi:bacteriorhodopsin
MRKSLFFASIVTALLSAVAVYIDWTVPFPLVAHPDGSFSINPLDDLVFGLGLIFCLATIVLAGLVRSPLRWFLMATGLLLFVFSLIGFVQNHV